MVPDEKFDYDRARQGVSSMRSSIPIPDVEFTDSARQVQDVS